MTEDFDLFRFLGTLSKRDQLAYDKLSDDGKKSAAPFVIQRWMTGTSDAAQIVRINTFVNPYAFSLGQEKGLLFKLLAASATGNVGRYSWLKGPSVKTATKLQLEVIKGYYGCSTREAAGYVIDADDIMEMAADLGWADEELKKLKVEVAKDGSGNAKDTVGKSKKRG